MDNKDDFVNVVIDEVQVSYVKISGGISGLLTRYAVSLQHNGRYERKNIIAENSMDFESKLDELVFMFKLNKNARK